MALKETTMALQAGQMTNTTRKTRTPRGVAAITQLSFALHAAIEKGVPRQYISQLLGVHEEWIAERAEAARLCLLICPGLELEDVSGDVPTWVNATIEHWLQHNGTAVVDMDKAA